MLTAGGFAPCLASAVGALIERYSLVAPEVEIIAYQYGYYGLLTGNSVVIDDEARAAAKTLPGFGGSPIGNSRVKLTNVKNLVHRGLVGVGQDPLEVAAQQLKSIFAMTPLARICNATFDPQGRVAQFAEQAGLPGTLRVAFAGRLAT